MYSESSSMRTRLYDDGLGVRRRITDAFFFFDFFYFFFLLIFFFFFKQKTAYEIYQCDWSSDVCSSDLS